MDDLHEFVPDFLLIGHIAHDVTPQGPRLGGTVSYGAYTAVAFGLRVGLLTSAQPGEPLLNKLPPGVRVINIPAEHTTTFDNQYTNGRFLCFLNCLSSFDVIAAASSFSCPHSLDVLGRRNDPHHRSPNHR